MNNKFKNKPSSFRNLQPTTYNLPPNLGFTLVEMLVSISVFLVVMLVAASSLLSIIDGNNKAQSLKSAINNLNFALEDMEKNIRVGTSYNQDLCSTNKDCIKFVSYKDSDNSGANDDVYYKLIGESIKRCVDLTTNSCSSDNDYTPMTAPEVHINYLGFYKTDPTEPEKARVLIVIGGFAGAKPKIQTKFNLQTTVSQRGF